MFKKPKDHYKIIGTLIGPNGETIELIDRAEYDKLERELEKAECVIEKLREQRNRYHTIAAEWGATKTSFEALENQIAEIERGEK